MCTQTPGHNNNLITAVVGLESACGLCELSTCTELPVSTLSQTPPFRLRVLLCVDDKTHQLWASLNTAWTTAWIWDCCTCGAHHSRVSQSGCLIIQMSISSASSHRNLQIHRSGSFQVICKLARSRSLSYLSTLSSLSVERKRHTHF